MKYIPLFLFTSIIASCQTNSQQIDSNSVITVSDTLMEVIVEIPQTDTTVYTYSWKEEYNYEVSLINCIEVPQGYKRIESSVNSFASWLQHLPISSDNTVFLYSGEKKYNQNAQYKVLDIDVGHRDLQQCADAVMRLRAEYLYASQQKDKIHFKYTNGLNIPFSKWSSGYYPALKGNRVVWTSSSNNDSYKSFKKYMINIFMYAGTASLEKELKSIQILEIQPGDVFIKGGFPGHAVIVVDVAINDKTKDKVFLIAQSYMPAQNIHILKNIGNDFSPWYSLSEIQNEIITPEWTFFNNQLKRFTE
jgi:hypothetical protein